MYVIRTITPINVRHPNIRTFPCSKPQKTNILPYIYLTYTFISSLSVLFLHFFSTISPLNFLYFLLQNFPNKKRVFYLEAPYFLRSLRELITHYPFPFLPLVPISILIKCFRLKSLNFLLIITLYSYSLLPLFHNYIPFQ